MTSSIKTILLVSLMTCQAASVLAADIPDSGQLLREVAPAPSLAPKSLPPLLSQPVEMKPNVSTGAKVKVAGFTCAGNTIFSEKELSALMSGYIGREMTFGELDAAAADITKAYRKKGYFLASALIPPQTVKPGMPLSIDIVEGTLDRVRIETTPAEPRIMKGLLQGFANRIPLGKPADEQSITSVVMKINELPNISSQIRLEPGTRPGTTQAVLDVKEGRPYGFSLDSDNYGNESTGRYRVGGGVELYSPLHLGDMFNLRFQESTNGDLENVQGGYTVPLFPDGTKAGVTYSYLNYTLGGAFADLNAYGTAQSMNFTLTRPLVRRRNLILNATLAGERQLLDDINEKDGSSNKRHTTSLQAGISGQQMDAFFGGGSTLFSLGVVGGTLVIDNLDALQNDQAASGLGTNGGYTKLSMSLSRTQAITGVLSFYGGAYGQWGDKNLTSSEQLSLGGPSGVRAWQPGDSSGDKGVVATAELRYLFAKAPLIPGSLQASIFVDHGYAVLHSIPLPNSGDNTRNLTGSGFGVKWFASSKVTMQATCAWKTAGETIPTNSPMMYIQAATHF